MAVDGGDRPFGGDPEQVVIEKDGVFKVVSALEVHAEGDVTDEAQEVDVPGPDSSTEQKNSGDVDTVVHQERHEAQDESTIEAKQNIPDEGLPIPQKDPEAAADASPTVTSQPETDRNLDSVAQSLDVPLSVHEHPEEPGSSSVSKHGEAESELPLPPNGSEEETPAVSLHEQPAIAQPPPHSSEGPVETAASSTAPPSAKEEDSYKKALNGGQVNEISPSASGEQRPEDSNKPCPQQATTLAPEAVAKEQQQADSVVIGQPENISSAPPAAKTPQTKTRTGGQRNLSAPVAQQTRGREASASANQERKRMNEMAFEAWLSKKNKEVLRRRELERKPGPSPEEIEQKKRENELAFQHWLVAKRRQASATARIQSSSTAKADTSAEDKEKENYVAWQSWLGKKLEQKRLENQLQAQQEKEMQELSKKTDPDVCQQAFKE